MQPRGNGANRPCRTKCDCPCLGAWRKTHYRYCGQLHALRTLSPILNELRGAEDLQIHLPHSRNNLLSQYLPDSFGPKDLDMTVRFLDAQNHGFSLPENGAQDDAVFQAALRELNRSYAPYSQAYAGVALRVESGEIFAGGYAENAAYNPTLPPLQVALNLLRLSGFHENQVREAVLICTEHGGHAAHTQALWSALSSVPLRILTLK